MAIDPDGADLRRGDDILPLALRNPGLLPAATLRSLVDQSWESRPATRFSSQ